MKKLGRTSLEVPAVGQGTAFNFSKLGKNEAAQIIRKGIDFGLAFVDTAENYGDGLVEEAVGEAIGGSRDKVVIATKFSPEHSRYDEVIKACDASLKRLNCDFIDLYQFHWPNPAVPLEETASALKELLVKGKIRYVGAGNFSLDEFEKLQKLINAEQLVSLQAEFNLFERTIEQNGTLEFCAQNKVSLIAYSPLDQGRLSAMSEAQKKLLQEIASAHGKTIAQVILGWLISKEPVIAVPKTASISHLKENAGSMDFELDSEELQRISDAFFQKLELVPIDEIGLPEAGEANSKVMYRTLNEAMENKLGFVPSPAELAEHLKKGGFLKPVRLALADRAPHGRRFDLIGGRIRYWAWIIAYGDEKPIPVYIREDIR